MTAHKYVFIAVLPFILFFFYIAKSFGVELGNVIAMATALFSVAFSLYTYYNSSKRLILNRNSEEQQWNMESYHNSCERPYYPEMNRLYHEIEKDFIN